MRQSQEEQPFEGLYRSRFTPVFRYAYSRLGNRELAEDVAQDVFLKVFERRDPGNPDDIPISYFLVAARNRIIDLYRKTRDIPMDFSSEEFVSIPDGADDPHRKAEQADLLAEVMEALLALPGEQGETVSLRHMAGLGYREIADVMGKSEEAVRQSYSRGIRKIRQSLMSRYEKGIQR